ncbi:hypothetical protein Nepgr_030402 [Nepenthes gracilis]|uniref:Uncharacterized protein n=1 Tax=Nepenthes gracilis TaxID=150966 RepID=A0AAD3Y612_NEPGR|nr:hypothetical protein Nepgr_030402 [Nepenthes gracilis]
MVAAYCRVANLDGEPISIKKDALFSNWTTARSRRSVSPELLALNRVFVILKRDHWLIRIAASYLVCGTDPPKVLVFVQSHDRAHVELMWLLSSTTPIGWPNRMIHFKEKSRRVGDNNVGVPLLPFPIPMAFDILLYQTDSVPIDDEQHRLLAYLANVLNERSGKTYLHTRCWRFNWSGICVVEQLYSPLDLEAPQGIVHEVLNPATCLPGKNFNLLARSPSDLAMMVGRTLDLRKEFHSIHQILLLVGTNPGDMRLWEICPKGKLIS